MPCTVRYWDTEIYKKVLILKKLSDVGGYKYSVKPYYTVENIIKSKV